MKKMLICVMILMISIGCGTEDTLFTDDGPDVEDTYAVETDVSISLNRTHVIMNRVLDNTVGVSGIYYAELGHPSRVKVLDGDSYASPVVNMGNGFMAYIQNGLLKYYDIPSRRISSSRYIQLFSSLALMNDTLLAAAVSDSIYVIHIVTDSIIDVIAGVDPTGYQPDTLVCLTFVPPDKHILNKLTFTGVTKSAQNFQLIPIDTVSLAEKVRRLSLEPTLLRYCFAVVNDTGFTVYSGKIDPLHQMHHMIAEIGRSRPFIIEFDKILYPGTDGRYYESTFDGSEHFPYWGAVRQ